MILHINIQMKQQQIIILKQQNNKTNQIEKSLTKQQNKIINILNIQQTKMDKLICQLCSKRLDEPKLCPHCSQIFCKKCITDYLAQKHFCPTCDNYIIDLVDCARLVSEFQEVLFAKKGFKGNYGKDGLRDCTKLGNRYKICKLHNLVLEYFCNKCKIWICSDCGVIESSHRGHDIVNRNEAEQINKQQLFQQLSKINQNWQKINSKKQRSLLDLQIYKTELKWSKEKIIKYCDQLLTKIDLQGAKQIQQLQQKMKQYDHLLDKLNKKREQIQNVLSISPRKEQFKTSKLKPEFSSKLIKRHSRDKAIARTQKKMELQQNINNIKRYSKQKSELRQKSKGKAAIFGKKIQKQPQFERSQSSIWIALKQEQQQQQQQVNNIFFNKVRKIQVIQQIFPPFANFTYQFDYQNLKMDNFHYSNYFQLWGQDWRLKIYPNGNSVVFGKFLSVFLELANGHTLQKSKKYVYRIQLLSLNKAGSTIAKQYCSVFESGESWGYSDYLNLSNLSQYLHQGKLLFSISIRNQSYEGLCNDLKKYIIKIENQNKILQKLLCESSHDQQQNSQINQYYQIKNSRLKQNSNSNWNMLGSKSISNINQQSSINMNINLDQSSDIQIQSSFVS